MYRTKTDVNIQTSDLTGEVTPVSVFNEETMLRAYRYAQENHLNLHMDAPSFMTKRCGTLRVVFLPERKSFRRQHILKNVRRISKAGIGRPLV